MNARIHTLAALTTLAFASVTTASAQEETLPPPRFALSASAGASLPTGDLKNEYNSGLLLAAQANYDFTRHLGLLGRFDWTNPSNKLVDTDTHSKIYQGDLGLEYGGARGNTKKWALRPFADLGGGVRRYDYSSTELNSHTSGVVFAGLGTDVAVGRSAIRLAATDNIIGYKAPTADATSSTRNEVGLSLGFGFHP